MTVRRVSRGRARERSSSPASSSGPRPGRTRRSSADAGRSTDSAAAAPVPASIPPAAVTTATVAPATFDESLPKPFLDSLIVGRLALVWSLVVLMAAACVWLAVVYLSAWWLHAVLAMSIAGEVYTLLWFGLTWRRLSRTFYHQQRETCAAMPAEMTRYLSRDRALVGHVRALVGRDRLSPAFLRRNAAYHLFGNADYVTLSPAQQKQCDALGDTIVHQLRATGASLPMDEDVADSSLDDRLHDSFMTDSAPLHPIYKPFCYYVGVAAMQWAFRIWARANGFTYLDAPFGVRDAPLPGACGVK